MISYSTRKRSEESERLVSVGTYRSLTTSYQCPQPLDRLNTRRQAMLNMFIRQWTYYLSVGAVALLTACGSPAVTGGDSAPLSPAAAPSSNTSTDQALATTTPSATVSQVASSTVAHGGSGIEGRTVIGPLCPVARANHPCPPQPYPAKINVMGSVSQQVAQAQSDTQGQFRIDLPPGTYILMPVSPGIYPRAAPQTVTVLTSGYISVTIAYDSGIR